VAATRMISIIGLKNAGKTTFLVALAAELVRRKFGVMTIKHGSHPADMDQKGKDTWRHWHEGRVERVLMEAPGQRVLFERTEAESDPITLAQRYLSDADIVLVEGFKRAPLPKIEVYRTVADRNRYSIPPCTILPIGSRWSRTTVPCAFRSPSFGSATPRGS